MAAPLLTMMFDKNRIGANGVMMGWKGEDYGRADKEKRAREWEVKTGMDRRATKGASHMKRYINSLYFLLLLCLRI
jgi:hypothetical protein